MDAKTRHELKQNELAEALAKLRRLDSPGTRIMLLGIVIIVVLFGAWKLWARSRDHALATGWQSLAAIDRPAAPMSPAEIRDRLRVVASDAADPTLAGYARLRLARVAFDQALSDPTQRAALLQEARAELETVKAGTATNPQLLAAVDFALAAVYESLGETDRARRCYEVLIDDAARFAGSPYLEFARERIESLDELREPVRLLPGNPPPPVQVEGPPPAPAGFEIPSIQLTPPATEVRPEAAPPPTTQPAQAEPGEAAEPEPQDAEAL